jgi:hypothetical protein
MTRILRLFTRQGLIVWTLAGRLKSIPFHGEPRLTDYLADEKGGDSCLWVC